MGIRPRRSRARDAMCSCPPYSGAERAGLRAIERELTE